MDTDETVRNVSETDLSVLLAKVLSASSEQAVRVQLGTDKMLLITPPGNTLFSNCRLEKIVSLLTGLPGIASLRYWSLTERETALAREELGDVMRFSAEALKWKIGEWYAVTNSSVCVDLVNDKVTLAYWPGFSAQPHTGDDLRIAAQWMIKPMSIIETATRLQVDVSRVMAFFAGAHAADLVTIAYSQAKVLVDDGLPEKSLSPISRRLKLAFKRNRSAKGNE